jgi:hypothetical protein
MLSVADLNLSSLSGSTDRLLGQTPRLVPAYLYMCKWNFYAGEYLWSLILNNLSQRIITTFRETKEAHKRAFPASILDFGYPIVSVSALFLFVLFARENILYLSLEIYRRTGAANKGQIAKMHNNYGVDYLKDSLNRLLWIEIIEYAFALIINHP